MIKIFLFYKTQQELLNYYLFIRLWTKRFFFFLQSNPLQGFNSFKNDWLSINMCILFYYSKVNEVSLFNKQISVLLEIFSILLNFFVHCTYSWASNKKIHLQIGFRQHPNTDSIERQKDVKFVKQPDNTFDHRRLTLQIFLFRIKLFLVLLITLFLLNI